MKIQDAIQIRNERKNLTAFLHHSDISKIEELMGCDINQKPVIWNELCNQVVDLYKNGQIKNKSLSAIFEILRVENPKFRTEMYRFDGDQLYRFNKKQNGFVFQEKCTSKEYNLRYANKYID